MDADAPPPLERLVEALLFVGGPPLTPARAAAVVRGLTAAALDEAVAALNRAYREQGRPYRVGARDGGYELALRPRYRGVPERLRGGAREARLSPPALDTLALVAYRQPVTRQEVEGLRGGESAGLLRGLVRLGLLAVRRGESNEAVYATTSRFLALFGLRDLDDLPRTQDLRKL